jgi:hypothetical protein
MPWWLIVAALVVALVGTLLATGLAATHLAMVGTNEEGKLLVKPIGMARLWAWSRGVEVPLMSIRDIGVAKTRDVPRGLRMPGTFFPRVLTAGTFRKNGEKSYWLVARGREVLVIELEDERYDRLVLDVQDPHMAAAALKGEVDRHTI